MTVWRWDKKEALLRFPLKEPLSVFKISRSQNEAGTSQICVGATQKGTFTVWQGSTGKVIAEDTEAHYLAINDLDISSEHSDMIATAGKDGKVKLWLMIK